MALEEIKSKDESNEGGHLENVDLHHSEIKINQDLMIDAVDGENHEHEMGIWTAVKSHPWACLWAFIMCFTIVSTSSNGASLNNADVFSI